MFLLPVEQSDGCTVEKELQGRNLQVDPRPICDRKEQEMCFEVTCIHHDDNDKGTTVTITRTHEEGRSWNEHGERDLLYFRVYDPSKEIVPSFVSTTYTHWGLENEIAPFGTVKVIIHLSAKVIREDAFRVCDKLMTCDMHDDVEIIEDSAFYWCTALTSIRLSWNLKKIGDYAFSGCKNMESCLMYDNVEEIGKYAFDWCAALTSIRLSRNLKKIGDYAFCGCKNMESCLMYDNVEEIGECAFYRCTALTSIRLSKKLKKTGHAAFNSCVSLDAIFLPPALNIEVFGNHILYECGNIRIVSLPAHMNAIPPQRIREKFSLCCNISLLFAQVDEDDIENNQDNDTKVHESYIQLNSNLPSLHQACLDANVTAQSIHECIRRTNGPSSSAFFTTISHGMMTPLHIMVMNPYADTGAILTCFHLNMSAAFERDDRGLSPLDYLLKYKNLDCLVLMVQGLCLHQEAHSKSCSISSLVDMNIMRSSTKKRKVE